MISKKIKISERAGEQAFEAAEFSCSGCQQSCTGKWFAPGNPRHNGQVTTLTDAEVTISGKGLNTIVAVLFGLPLLLLLGLAYAFQASGITAAAPLVSFAAIAIALFLAGVVLIKHGAKLIPLLRVEVDTPPDRINA